MATKYLDEGGLTTLVGQTKTYVTNSLPNEMTAATSSADGKSGLVPKPTMGSQEKFLRGDGTWVKIGSGIVYSSNEPTDKDNNTTWIDG